MRKRIIRLLILIGLVYLFAVLGRELSTAVFSEFFYDYSGRREDNAVMRVLFRVGGLATGGVLGAVLAYLFSRRPTE